MNKFSGYSLVGAGLLGVLFSLIYRDSAIQLKELWFVVSFTTIVAGAYVLAKYTVKGLDNRLSNNGTGRWIEIEQLKRTGDKVKVTLENAEVRSRSFQQEASNEDWPTRLEMLDALYDTDDNYKTQESRQTYIVFYKQYDGKTYKFVSQPTKQNVDTVRRHIDRQKGVDLYIDAKNPTNYHFDLPYVLR